MRRISSRATLFGVAMALLCGQFVAQSELAFDLPRSLLRRFGGRRPDRPGSQHALLLARPGCGAGAWNSLIQACTPSAALARPATTCPRAIDGVRVSSAELREPVLRLDMPLLDTARGLQDVLDEKGIGRTDLVLSPGEKVERRS